MYNVEARLTYFLEKMLGAEEHLASDRGTEFVIYNISINSEVFMLTFCKSSYTAGGVSPTVNRFVLTLTPCSYRIPAFGSGIDTEVEDQKFPSYEYGRTIAGFTVEYFDKKIDGVTRTKIVLKSNTYPVNATPEEITPYRKVIDVVTGALKDIVRAMGVEEGLYAACKIGTKK